MRLSPARCSCKSRSSGTGLRRGVRGLHVHHRDPGPLSCGTPGFRLRLCTAVHLYIMSNLICVLHVFTFCWLLNKNTVQDLLWSGQTRSNSQSGKLLLSHSKFYYIMNCVFAVCICSLTCKGTEKKKRGIFNQYVLGSLSSIYYAASAIIIVEVDLCLLQLVVYHTQRYWRGKFRTVFADANWGQNKKCLVYLIFAGLALTAASRFPTACHFSKAHYETYYSTLITFRAAGGERGLTWTSSGVHLGGLITSELCLISNGSCIPVEHVEERGTSRGSRMSVFLYECMWLHASTAVPKSCTSLAL